MAKRNSMAKRQAKFSRASASCRGRKINAFRACMKKKLKKRAKK